MAIGVRDRIWDVTCPIVRGSLVRFLLRMGQSAAAARAVVVSGLEADDRHEFWLDTAAFAGAGLNGLIGHRQPADLSVEHSDRRGPSSRSPQSHGTGPVDR
jgi:hypothetical protein